MTTPKSASNHSVRVSIRSLSKTFRNKKADVRVLDNLSLDVEEGEMLVLLGPSGCGKTTLLRCVVGLEQADSGSIELSGQKVAEPDSGIFVPADKRGVGMVFQNYALWPHMTVAANVAFPLRARGMASAIGEGRVQEVLEIVQCAHLADRYPPQLSGGQQQRVSLARALASRPDVLLLDEPLSNLDALLRIELRAQLRQLHRSLGFTGIYVTHDQVEALNIATRVVVMRNGRIEQAGDPEEIYRLPANEYVAEFLGMRNRVPCMVTAEGMVMIGEVALDMTADHVAPGNYHLRTRPSEIGLRSAGAESAANMDLVWVPGGRVIDRLPSGETTDFIVEFADQQMFLERRGDGHLPSIGDSVEIGFNRNALLYGTDGERVLTCPTGQNSCRRRFPPNYT